MKKNRWILTALLICPFLVNSCKIDPERSKTVISVKGSDTMVNLTQRWAEEFMKLNPGVSIHVTGGGSGNGIAALLNGTADVANISRELQPDEIKKAEKLGIAPKFFKVALDGIAIIVHPSNPVDTLRLDELRDIFSGKITNWKDVGGNDSKIVLYGRESSSGTYEFFKMEILGNDVYGNEVEFAPATQVLQGTAALGEAVTHDFRGIGYGGAGYFINRRDLKILYLKPDSSSTAFSPASGKHVNKQLIRKKLYPLSRYLYCFTDGKPAEEIQKYIEFIKSSGGQKIVEEMEYIPLKSEK